MKRFLVPAGLALADNLGTLTSDADRGYRAVTHAETVEFGREHSQRDLTEEDAREAATNVVGFFTVLSEWREAMDSCEVGGGGDTSSSCSNTRRDS